MKHLLTALIAVLALPLVAQDFGYPQEKAFFKAHWQEILADLDREDLPLDTHYVLYDFDHDGGAELYLWFSKGEEYLFARQGGKAVRVSETARPIEDNYWLGAFYAHYMAPYQLLIDQPIEPWQPMEQQVYDMFEVPRIWFGMRPKVEGKFNIKTAIEAVTDFDCDFLSSALYALYSGQYLKEEVEEYVVDVTNGYACLKANSRYMNMVELCYWNMDNGKKLFAMHYHTSNDYGGEVDWFEQTLFMEYDPKTQQMLPVVAPIKGMDLQMECNFALPRRGKNIRLIGADESELRWNGHGFEY